MQRTDKRLSRLLGAKGWFEDFEVGQRIRHSRASTVDELEGSFIAKLVMNTAQAHWNEHIPNPLVKGRLVFGLATGSLVLGLSAQDTMEHAIAELRYDRFRFRAPIQHMDTVSAYSDVLSKEEAPERSDAGVVAFKHYGVRQDGVLVFEGERTALIKKKSYWSEDS